MTGGPMRDCALMLLTGFHILIKFHVIAAWVNLVGALTYDGAGAHCDRFLRIYSYMGAFLSLNNLLFPTASKRCRPYTLGVTPCTIFTCTGARGRILALQASFRCLGIELPATYEHPYTGFNGCVVAIRCQQRVWLHKAGD